MILLKVATGVYVSAIDIEAVTVDPYARRATVRMKDGTKHTLQCDYGVDIYTTIDRFVAKIDHAVKTMLEVHNANKLN